ncbi:hypothetical protein SAMN05444817_11336 [Corynebacterium appendicis CIP 107643]|uniref:Integral membrane protein n=1 Tax=Corynebacterium appendicis CIP 107643 TaxID=1161099 RepID=A0A1N7K216_9CORY|nr:hypothetical protein [Corynebacterium appendicis]MCT1685002.1 hypothetical protein [Corynebacterium appendicis]MDK8625642.1 hypothetical protein [Corynebacterium appendicis]WJY60462.1 hypothetical protein CAPP_02605 [Corynebacterium appendicis CIP 107643]SIS55639.1 hypothetical protein SAMN05444817_11336 [Corynebacterium appendicis CIP 107643]
MNANAPEPNKNLPSPEVARATAEAPAPMKAAAVMAVLEGIVAIGYGIYLAFAQVTTGADESLVQSDTSAFALVGVGTALFILFTFGPMAYGGINILRGNQWGRSIIVFMNVLLLGIAFYMFLGGATLLGTVTLLAAAITLVCALHPVSTEWATAAFDARRGK